MADYVGQQLGNYRLLRLLGQGSFAAVYLGEHLYLERPAAIKVLHVQMEPKAQEAFRREARTIARLQHPHIVQVHDFGIEGQTPYLVMEYTPGGTLRERYPKGTCLTYEQIITSVKQIASALDYAHLQRVIHRDIKPANLLLNAKGEVVLSDFGIAVVQRTLESLSQQNAAGTPLYMAPEQIQHQPCPQSDQYALGVMVYEWLCGEPPFRGPGVAIFGQHLHQAPPSLCARLPRLPPAIEDAVFGALAKDPTQRFPTVQDFATVLEEACFATQPLVLQVSQGQDILPLAPSVSISAHASKGQDGAAASRPSALISPQHRASEQELAPFTTPGPVTQSHLTSQQTKVSVAQRNRQALLRKVQSFWIEGVLSHSLHGAALMALGLETQPDAVANPWHLVLQHPDAAPRPLPAGTRITQVYDDAQGELLILGAPGAGKTTLILELARDLLARAEHDEQHPMPVIFNLSSWAMKQQPLVDWLVEELSTKYQVPPKLGQALVSADQILPLLDGLDEVAPTARTACIEAINTYRREHGLLPLVVCSRQADYLAQTGRLLVHSAVTVQPIVQEQVHAYLAQGGEPLWALRMALHQDAALRELTSTPLMLSILTLTYHGTPVEELLRGTPMEERQRQIFEQYVGRMLARRGPLKAGTPQQVVQWLTFLGKQMQRHDQTIFSVENLQPTWLSKKWRILYGGCIGPIVGLVGGLIFGLAGGPVVGLVSWLMGGTVVGLVVGLIFGLVFGPMGLVGGLVFGLASWIVSKLDTGIHPAEAPTWSWKKARSGLMGGLIYGLPFGLLIGLFGDLIGGLIYGLIGGLFAGPVFWLVSGSDTGIHPAEELTWSWKKARSGLIFGLVLWPVLWLVFWLVFGPVYGLLIGLIYGLIGGLIFGLIGGLSGRQLPERLSLSPNEGIWRSGKHGLVFGLIFGLIVVPISIFGLSDLLLDDMNSLVIFCLVGGPLSGLGMGGLAAFVRHFILRFWLWRTNCLPWELVPFLDEAAERLLLRKVGGSYIFVHRLLLDYFVALEKKAP